MARTAGSHSDITGPRVRAAALRLFARDGYAAVSMRAIAGEVGVQAGALYNYTTDKQSLLSDLLRSHMEELLEARKGAEDLPPLEALEQFTRLHIRFPLERSGAVCISSMELRNLDPESFSMIEALRGAYENQLETILRRGVETDQFDVPDNKIATMGLIAMMTGVTTWYQSGGRLSLDQVEEIYWDMIRKSVAR